jgi:hypothetical protein
MPLKLVKKFKVGTRGRASLPIRQAGAGDFFAASVRKGEKGFL